MKKIYVLIICLFVGMGNIKADYINSVNADVFIDDNGNASVTMKIRATKTEGTEWYLQYKNLDRTTISNFKVFDEIDNKEYTFVDNWDVNASLREKSYKNGFHQIDNGVELCWGVADFSTKIYIVTFTFDNAVYNYEDKQILYLDLIPNVTSDLNNFNATIKYNKTSDAYFSTFGYDGNNYKSNNYYSTTGALNAGDHVTLLLAFPPNTFNLVYSKQGTLQDVKKLAGDTISNKIVNVIKENIIYIFEEMPPFVSLILLVFIGIIIKVILTPIIKLFPKKHKKHKKLKYKNVQYCRDIPFEKNLLLSIYPGVKNYVIQKEHLLGAYILKWIKQEKVKIIETNNEYYLDLNNLKNFENDIDKAFASMLISASHQHILYPNDFEKWLTENGIVVNVAIELALTLSLKENISKEYILNSKKITYTKKLYTELKKLIGLRKFLEDLSSIDDKKSIEIHMWDNYLLYAELFGIADQVAKELNVFHPDYFNVINYKDFEILDKYVNIYSTHSYSDNKMINAINKQRLKGGSNLLSIGASFLSGGKGSTGSGGSFGGR